MSGLILLLLLVLHVRSWKLIYIALLHVGTRRIVRKLELLGVTRILVWFLLRRLVSDIDLVTDRFRQFVMVIRLFNCWRRSRMLICKVSPILVLILFGR